LERISLVAITPQNPPRPEALVIYDHLPAYLDIGMISLPQSFLRASDGKMAPALAEVISANEPRIASGWERVRLGPIENALSLVSFPLSKVGALSALGL
jgi:hypothetical protein